MTRPRSQLIDYCEALYYHITSRCVRRAFLCGEDPQTQKSYEHRRQWIEDRLRLLSSLFTLEICTYCIMHNHIHIILKAIPDEADCWDDHQVIRRWLSIFKGPLIAHKYLSGESLSKAENDTLSTLLLLWRSRLTDISWFMKCLNEPIARQANKEDNCTGHFWEARFHSQALLDDQAILTAMAYVDLNPVRARIASTPESSKFTSIKERIHPAFDLNAAIKSYCEHGGFSDHLLSRNDPIHIRPLAQFTGGESLSNQDRGVHFDFKDYLELLDFTGQVIREDKTGFIDNTLPPILDRLSIDGKSWFENCQHFETLYYKRFRSKHLLTG